MAEEATYPMMFRTGSVIPFEILQRHPNIPCVYISESDRYS